jgi:hypothetical protein
MFVHDHVPTGIAVMAERRAQFSYSFEDLFEGGRVRIQDQPIPTALKAIQEFLRFQIEEHKQGTPMIYALRSPRLHD